MARRIGPLAGWAIILLAAAFASWACFRQFGGYDLSPLIDLFWRMSADQVPGRDFINTWPPLLILIAWVVGKWQMGWFELTFANILLTMAAYAAVIAMTDRAKRSVAWCSAVAVILVLPLVYTNHIWHSSLSQLCAIPFFFAVYGAMEDPVRRRRHDVALFLCAAFLAVAKQNVALPILAATLVLILVVGGERRWRLAALIVGGAVSGIGFCLLMLRMSVESFLHIYTAVLGRGRPTDEMLHAMMDMASNRPSLILLLLSLALLCWSIWNKRPATIRQLLLFGGFVLLALLPILTDWDAKLNNISLPLFVVATHVMVHMPTLGLDDPRTVERSRVQQRLLGALLIGMLAIAVIGGVQRERMYHVGPGAFYELPADHIIAKGYFAHMHGGGTLAGVVAQIDRLKAAAPRARLFFGPRLEFGYAETQTASPKALPLWWHPGTSYSVRDDQDKAIRAFEDNLFDKLIFLKDDRTRMPRAILDIIARDYRLRQTGQALDIYDRRRRQPLS